MTSGKTKESNQSSVISNQQRGKKVISLPYEARRAKWGAQVIGDQKEKSVEGRVISRETKENDQ